MADRRRVNGPAGGTAPPVFASLLPGNEEQGPKRPIRTRKPNEPRKIYLKTGLTPSASGSAYLELEPKPAPRSSARSLIPITSALKLTCTVHGPRPLPRSSPFTPHILLTTHIKFAPFAARQRRGYIRDASERDLAAHLETALRGVIIGDRWPKSGVEVVVTILEGEEDRWCGDVSRAPANAASGSLGAGWGMMNVLAGCITVASAAIADAGIDCVDLVAGGVAAVVSKPDDNKSRKAQKHQNRQQTKIVLDPSPAEHRRIHAACVVGYLSSRDEITELWIKGDLPSPESSGKDASIIDDLINDAVRAAIGTRAVLGEAVREAVVSKLGLGGKSEKQTEEAVTDAEMST